MMDTHLNTKRIPVFLAFAFGIPWTAALVLSLTIGKDDMPGAQMLANMVFVFTPAPASLATRLITKEGWRHLMVRPNFRRGWRFYLAAWLLPLLAIIVGGAVYYLLFPQSFDPNLGGVQTLLFATSFAPVDNPWTLMLVLAALYMFVCVPILGLQGIGEELGWRGYLLPKLVERLAGPQRPGAGSAGDRDRAGGLDHSGAGKAALLVGVIWGVWHWPLLLMSMTYDPGMPILYLLTYVVSTCSLSVLLSWVTLGSGSVWPAVIGHAANNWTIGLTMGPLKGAADPLLGPAPSGLVGVTGYVALALVLLFRRKAFIPVDEAGSEKGPAVSGAQEYEPLA